MTLSRREKERLGIRKEKRLMITIEDKPKKGTDTRNPLWQEGWRGKKPCQFNLSLSLYTVQLVSVLVEIVFHLVQVDLAAVRHIIYSSQSPRLSYECIEFQRELHLKATLIPKSIKDSQYYILLEKNFWFFDSRNDYVIVPGNILWT